MKKLALVAACALVMGMAGTASAYDFDMGSGSDVSGPALSDPGLVMQYEINPNLDSVFFSLDPGEQYTFDFATFWTNETSVDSDDIIPQDMTASVDFDMPDLFADVDGSSVGTIGGWWGFNQGWEITLGMIQSPSISATAESLCCL